EGHVADLAAPGADEVVVLVLDVGVNPVAAGPEVEEHHLPHGGEVVDGLVHGLQRDRRHPVPGRLVERFDRRVSVVAVEQPEDRLTLRGHPQALLPKQFGELINRLHDNASLSTAVVSCQPGSTRWIREAAGCSLCVLSGGLTDFSGGNKLTRQGAWGGCEPPAAIGRFAAREARANPASGQWTHTCRRSGNGWSSELQEDRCQSRRGRRIGCPGSLGFGGGGKEWPRPRRQRRRALELP